MSLPPESPAAPATDAWRPSGIVTLLTDFGVEDAYVGIMKGVIASVGGPTVRAIDLTHAVAPQDVRSAAFHLAHAWRWFPPGTVHAAVCDPGVGTERAIVVVRAGGHAFVAPDNGLLGPVLASVAGEPWLGRLDVERVALPGRGRTFHGRDVFAPAAARMAAGVAPEELCEPVGDCARVALPLPESDGDAFVATIVSVDRFGNLVGNVAAGAVADGSWSAVAGERRARLVGAYGEAAPGELIALVDSYGLVELAVRDGSAAAELGLVVGDRFRLERSA